ncbi:MAG: 6,7-dimethyl-8-ribityllumazine synthase [Candidatus Thalassarchaeaceae archaeon]|jgi:6,7-dimethyl-8-ribityllumazine synthase|nr:6,7-dimethyl-8-ribityllumazine synthase [Candidatus Thalassarchaeaceae archaeon]MDP6318374.1 6,7-dimethyl-8-ribityllumazine synthase [Candidatus Thalassarchaeaceae archaeon]HJM30343.1 6,7-dimethyl-8-ribityllumazine synthase [Candidatus Thalassarchaeaceae archaeon]HJN70106.1 6,7-dimethyl-8-ribityllumazine synthase [Candidatus Thalassarchaeaceae archaeon]|tara:strand:+ start:807 stop:1202 length:396 start_codon:yes stop_codon:yes gene_type:complete
MRIAAVCGSFHKVEVERMLEYARDEAASKNAELTEVVWVPGSMEAPLALERLMQRDDVDAAIALGIIERGQTQHGLVMGQSVTRSIIELQIRHNKPIGLGIIGPGADPEHIEPRLEPHARAAVGAVVAMFE